jgi:hypothetical protein
MIEHVLWGTRKGAPEWDEEPLCTQPERFAEVRELAAADGFEKFRESAIDLSVAPDFSKTINTGKSKRRKP